jgi:hypothetical protein
MPRLNTLLNIGGFKAIAPIWVTASGTIATIADQNGSYSNIATVVASAPGGRITYAITSGSLPSGCSLNANTGVISGDPADVTSNTTYTFSITPYNYGVPGLPRSFSIVVNTTYFIGTYYSETLDANSKTAGWSNTTTYYMADFGGLGSGYAHGYSPSSFYNFTISGLPRHSNLRYIVYYHMVDSLDNETNYVYTTDTNGSDVERFRFTKVYNAAPSFSVIASGASQSWNGGKSYSYRPWGNGTYGNDGYSILDTGYYAHTASTFTAKHYFGGDQAQADEAEYLSHIQIILS